MLFFFLPHILFYLFIYFYFLTLQYCIGFAIYQNESAPGIHVFPILNPPPFSLPIPCLWSSQGTSPRHPETLMYRTVFWALWERERVGWFGRMALKHVFLKFKFLIYYSFINIKLIFILTLYTTNLLNVFSLRIFLMESLCFFFFQEIISRDNSFLFSNSYLFVYLSISYLFIWLSNYLVISFYAVSDLQFDNEWEC